MLTSLSKIYDIQEKEVGYLTTEREVCKAGEKYPIYIPRLMPKIPFGEPKTTILSSKGPLIFLNDSSCRVLADRLLKSRNYLEIPFERNKSWGGDQVNVYRDDDGNIISTTLKPRTKVTCNCKTDLTDDMTFSND